MRPKGPMSLGKSKTRKLLLIMLLAGAAGVMNASATTTQSWEMSTFDDFKEGEFEGTVLTSEGEIMAGRETVRRELLQDAGVWSHVIGKGGDVFLGTGNRGALQLLRGRKLYDLTQTESVVLTAMTVDKNGNVYAAGMPGAQIYRFSPKDIKDLVKEASSKQSKDSDEEWKKREYKSDKKEEDKEDKEEEKAGEKNGMEEKKGKKDEAADEEKDKGKKAEEGKEEEGKDKDKDTDKAEDTDKDKEKDKKEGKAAAEGKGKKKAKAKKDEKEKKKRTGPEPWAVLEDADQIWSLLYDAKRNLLFAGTGPKGKIYSIDAAGRANIYMDTGEEHVFSLAHAGKDRIAAGTGNRGRLLLVEGPGRGSVLWDFDATEVKNVLYLKQPGSNKVAIVATVNKFKSMPSLAVSKPSLSMITQPSGKKQPSNPPPLGGEGKVVAVFEDSGMRVLYEDDKTHFTFMQPKGEGSVLVGDGQKGRIFEVDLEGNYSILYDLEERQVLTFHLEGNNAFIGTSDPAAIYRLTDSAPMRPYYVSKVFDAGFPAKWGKIVIRSEGKVAWQTRSGNTKKTDKWWTDWTKLNSSTSGEVLSGKGRFFQLRLRVPSGAAAWNVRVFYLAANQQAVVREITLDGEKTPASKSSGTVKSGSKKADVKHDPVIKLEWKVDNPDEDELRYELFFAKEGEEKWISILKEGEELNEKKYSWDTTSIPAGYYLIKVVAGDEPANDPRLSADHARISKPVLVDNDPPQIWMDVAVKQGVAVVSGKVSDNFSTVGAIQYSVDGKLWKNIFPLDTIFDDQSESFKFGLGDLEPGAHTVTVRAMDEAQNMTSTG
ncbi:MAG: hypothetical protein ABIJ56_16395, partial [Pseudomonadota bacterium]